MKSNPFVVSVCVQTYNQEEFISDCLDGILMQEVDFPLEIILGEDDSKDRTREICEHYANKHPQLIRLFLRDRKDVIFLNGKASGRYNLMENLRQAEGKYIAICEGDDYWTDPLKLQKQVDFLETNPEYGICFHNVEQINILDGIKKDIIPNLESDQDINITSYIESNKTATCSMVFRRLAFFPMPDWFDSIPFGDLGITLNILEKTNKKAWVMSDVMAVYRIHEKGIHGSLHKDDRSLAKAFRQHIVFINILKRTLLSNSVYKIPILRKKITTNELIWRFSKTNSWFAGLRFKIRAIYYKIILKYFS